MNLSSIEESTQTDENFEPTSTGIRNLRLIEESAQTEETSESTITLGFVFGVILLTFCGGKISHRRNC